MSKEQSQHRGNEVQSRADDCVGAVQTAYEIRFSFVFFQAEDGIRDRSPSRGLGDVYKRQLHLHNVLQYG